MGRTCPGMVPSSLTEVATYRPLLVTGRFAGWPRRSTARPLPPAARGHRDLPGAPRRVGGRSCPGVADPAGRRARRPGAGPRRARAGRAGRAPAGRPADRRHLRHHPAAHPPDGGAAGRAAGHRRRSSSPTSARCTSASGRASCSARTWPRATRSPCRCSRASAGTSSPGPSPTEDFGARVRAGLGRIVGRPPRPAGRRRGPRRRHRRAACARRSAADRGFAFVGADNGSITHLVVARRPLDRPALQRHRPPRRRVRPRPRARAPVGVAGRLSPRPPDPCSTHRALTR